VLVDVIVFVFGRREIYYIIMAVGILNIPMSEFGYNRKEVSSEFGYNRKEVS
jgi:hypothetical protein